MAFPPSPTAGQTYTTVSGITYIFTANGYWIAQSSTLAHDGSLTGNGTASSNLAVVQSTETQLGGAKAATQAIADAGVDDTTFITPKKLKQYMIDNPVSTPAIYPSWPVGSVITAFSNITQDFVGRPRLGNSPAYPLVVGEDPTPLTPPYPQYLMTACPTNLMTLNSAGALPGVWVYVGGINAGQANFQRIS